MAGWEFSARSMSALAFLIGLIFVVIGTTISRVDMQVIGMFLTITGVFASVITRYVERPRAEYRQQA